MIYLERGHAAEDVVEQHARRVHVDQVEIGAFRQVIGEDLWVEVEGKQRERELRANRERVVRLVE